MNRHKTASSPRIACVAVLAAACMLDVHAQSTLGEVLDQGGVKLTPAAWGTLLPHKNFGFGQQSQNRTEVTFAPDGTLSGTEQLWDPHGYDYRRANSARSSRDLKGTWTMEADGKICIDQVSGKYEDLYKGCFVMYKLGEFIFHVAPEAIADRRAPITRRRIEK